jgi:hypothetical protein
MTIDPSLRALWRSAAGPISGHLMGGCPFVHEIEFVGGIYSPAETAT